MLYFLIYTKILGVCNSMFTLFRNILLIFCFVLPAFAGASDALSVVVPVANQSEQQRMMGFGAALQLLANRFNENLSSDHLIDFTVPLEHPEQYVESFSYITDPESTDVLQMAVHFDRHALQDFLPQQHAVPVQNFVIEVNGIHSASNLQAVEAYLTHVPSLQSVFIRQVFNDKVELVVAFEGDKYQFIQALHFGQHLSAENTDKENQSLLSFEWIE